MLGGFFTGWVTLWSWVPLRLLGLKNTKMAFNNLGRMVFGKFSVQDKKALVASSHVPFLTLLFGGHFVFLNYPKIGLVLRDSLTPGDLSPNGGAG